MKQILRAGRLPFKSVVELAFHHEPAPYAITNAATQRPAVVNVHGIFGSNKLFRPLNKPLAEGLNTDVYSIDLRNHGNSPRALPYDYVSFTRDVIHFIKKEIGEHRPVQVIGFSSGGKIALLSSLCPHINVQKCISIDMPPYATPNMDPIILQNYELIMKIIRREIKIKKGSKNWRQVLLGYFKKVPANIGNKGDPSLYFANGFYMVKENGKSPSDDQEDPYIDFYLPLDQFPNLITEVKKWPNLRGDDNADGLLGLSTEAQVLFMRGMRSCFIKDDYSLLKTSFPNSIVEEYDTGHNITVEKPEICLRNMIDFLRD